MARNALRKGSVFHVDAADGHRYFIISDREFSDCGRGSESSYTMGCRCDACRDDHAVKEARRRRVRKVHRARREATEGPGRLPAA